MTPTTAQSTRGYSATKDQLRKRLARIDHARHCVIGGEGPGEPEELTEELMAAVGRLMRRG